MVWLKALGAFRPYTRGLLEVLHPLSCLVDVVTKHDSEKSSILNYVETAGLYSFSR